MDDGVVSPAHQGQVREVGCSAVDPVDQVVGIAPMRRSRAAGERAPRVPQPEDRQLCRRRQAGGAAQVQDLPPATQDSRDDRRVARQPTHRLRRDQHTTLRGTHHRRRTHPRREVVVGQGQHERGLDPQGWPVNSAGGAAAYLRQGLPATSLRAARVTLPIRPRDRRGQWPDCRFQRRRTSRVQYQLVGECTEFVAVGSGQRNQPFGRVGVGLELPICPMRRQQRRTQRPDPTLAVSDPHVQQALQDGWGGLLTQPRPQPGELTHHCQRHGHAHRTRDRRGPDRNQAGARAFPDQPGDLPRPIPRRKTRRMFNDPPSRRPGLRRGDLPSRLRLTDDRDPRATRDSSERVELAQQRPQLRTLHLPQPRHQLSDNGSRSSERNPSFRRVESRCAAVHDPDANSDHRQTSLPKRPLPQRNRSR